MLTKFVFTFLIFAGTFSLTHGQGTNDPAPIHQLRIYTLPKENRQVFHERFRDHAQRIMKKYGFNIVSIWESVTDNNVEFIYLLEWKDKKTMEESWKNFMADQEWKDIKKRTSELHGTYVENIEDRTLILTDYSPQKFLRD
jgi:heme-degrading monooxygenase HmoA